MEKNISQASMHKQILSTQDHDQGELNTIHVYSKHCGSE